MNLANEKEVFGIQKQHEIARGHKRKVVDEIKVTDLSSQDDDTMYKPKFITSPGSTKDLQKQALDLASNSNARFVVTRF